MCVSLHGCTLAAVEFQRLVESLRLVGSELDSDVVNSTWIGSLQPGQRRRLHVVTAAPLYYTHTHTVSSKINTVKMLTDTSRVSNNSVTFQNVGFNSVRRVELLQCAVFHTCAALSCSSIYMKEKETIDNWTAGRDAQINKQYTTRACRQTELCWREQNHLIWKSLYYKASNRQAAPAHSSGSMCILNSLLLITDLNV